MNNHVNGVSLGVFLFFFVAVTVIGFLATRWRRAETAASLDEWGLGGRSFGTWVTWFLLGGDLYTAYTFVAVPAAIYAAGAAGFFAVPYTILVYPLVFMLPAAAVVGFAPARLRHAVGLRARAVRLQGPVAGGRAHRHPRHDAVHRAPTGRHPGGAGRDGGRRRSAGRLVRQGPAAAHRLRGARRVHLLVGAAGARADRVRQGHADLPGHRGGDHLHPDQARRLRPHLPPGGPGIRHGQPGDRQAARRAGQQRRRTSGRTAHWRSARRWRCSCTRTRSPRRCPAAAARGTPQHHDPAAVLADARPAGHARLHGAGQRGRQEHQGL